MTESGDGAAATVKGDDDLEKKVMSKICFLFERLIFLIFLQTEENTRAEIEAEKKAEEEKKKARQEAKQKLLAERLANKREQPDRLGKGNKRYKF